MAIFGPELRRFILTQYHQGQVTVDRLLKQLDAIGIEILKRQIMRLLIDGQDGFVAEVGAVLHRGLQTSAWVTVDDTGARHKAMNGVCTQIGNDRFAWFSTTNSKSRVNFLGLLRAGHDDYIINAAALAYMRGATSRVWPSRGWLKPVTIALTIWRPGKRISSGWVVLQLEANLNPSERE